MSVGLVEEIRVETWEELEKWLFADSWWPELKRHRQRYVFRGLSDSAFQLTTTLQRMGGPIRDVEPLMLRQFKKYAHRDVIASDTDWHWLAVAKHHDLPTRLLDWTNSPFVALHFATADWPQFVADGVVWAVNFIGIHNYLPDQLRDRLKRLRVKNFAATELAEVADSLEKLESLSTADFMVFFEPPSIDDRIANQYAVLSTMSRAETVPETWLRSRPEPICRKMIIPRSLKPEIRERLDIMNMTERVFFPGLDGLSTWLRRYYGPSSRNVQDPLLLYKGKYLHFFRRPNGWEYVQRPQAAAGVVIVAVTTENRLLLVEQHRPALDRSVIELPSGIIDPGDDGSVTVMKELKQETGYVCRSAERLCEGANSPGFANEVNVLYRAVGLVREDSRGEDSFFDDGTIRHGQIRGIAEEGEHINVWEVPLPSVLSWLDKRRKENDGLVVDFRLYAGLFFACRETT